MSDTLNWSLTVPLHLLLKMVRYVMSLDGNVLWVGTESWEEQKEFDCLDVTKLHCRGDSKIQDESRKYLYGLAQANKKVDS